MNEAMRPVSVVVSHAYFGNDFARINPRYADIVVVSSPDLNDQVADINSVPACQVALERTKQRLLVSQG